MKASTTGKKQRVASERIIMGRNCLREVLHHAPERLETIYIAEHDRGQLKDCDDILGRIEKLHIKVEMIPRDKMCALTSSDAHQSFAARLKPRPPLDYKALLLEKQDAPHSLLLFLDGIQDPHNFGTILRAAECFGADAVIWSQNRGAALTPAVSKASVGASELVPLVAVSNLVTALKKCQAAGFWVVVADAAPDAQTISEFQFPEKTALVVGSEGQGVASLVKQIADFTLKIPMLGHISSLNVSQATTLLLWEYRRSY
ncbi:23S rRNA (guanosine(2251)-2'-O)-methyltransferase RlmB [Oligoflexia bacterium]|nr:23S rRNA (guanosine(2251)-2'-O)-methyltransferase RlmB [Oligoflexia bacterium]